MSSDRINALQGDFIEAHRSFQEKVLRIIKQALDEKLPVVILSSSYGVAFVEGVLREKGIPIGDKKGGVEVFPEFGCNPENYLLVEARRLL